MTLTMTLSNSVDGITFSESKTINYEDVKPYLSEYNTMMDVIYSVHMELHKRLSMAEMEHLIKKL